MPHTRILRYIALFILCNLYLSINSYAQSYVIIESTFTYSNNTQDVQSYYLPALNDGGFGGGFGKTISLTKQELLYLCGHPYDHYDATTSDGLSGHFQLNTLFASSFSVTFNSGYESFYGDLEPIHLLPMDKPQKASGVIGDVFCGGDVVTLEAYAISNFYGKIGGFCYSSGVNEASRTHGWEYKRTADSYWSYVPSSFIKENTNIKTAITFSLKDLAPDITSTADISFRVVSSSSSYVPYGRVYSDPFMLTFMPAAPQLVGSITTEKSCSNTPTGKIKLNGITPTGNVRYILRRGKDNNNIGSCKLNEGNVEDIKGCLSNVELSGILPANLTIENVSHGAYTLLLANDGGDKGGCFSWYNVEVEQIEPLCLIKTTAKPVSCPGGNDGEVYFQFKNGLLPININGTQYNTRDITIKNLASQTYTSWSATDGCHVTP